MANLIDHTAPPPAANASAEINAPTAVDAGTLHKTSLIGLEKPALGDLLLQIGIPERQIRMRSAQLWRWMYAHGATSFDVMSDISKELRQEFASRFTLARPKIINEQVSIDGTRKWLIQLAKHPTDVKAPEVEAVYIPEPNRGTLCVSSQVGCTLNCSFCHTGTQRLVRNLTAGEILAQILIARDQVGEWPSGQTDAQTPPAQSDSTPAEPDKFWPRGERKITNIVLMGMGEPLYNFDATRAAMAIASDDGGLAFSKRRITLSTSGVVPEIERWGAEAGTMLAISLHAVRNDLRDTLVPINKRYPIEMLLDACRTYPGVSNARRITFEYVMLAGVNDQPADARELVRLLRGIPAKINLIPFNPWPGTQYECSSWENIEKFADIINRAGYASPVRTPRGRDILAACGQLKSESERLSAKHRATAEPTDQ